MKIKIEINCNDDGIIKYASTSIENGDEVLCFNKSMQGVIIGTSDIRELLDQDFKKYIDNFNLLSKVRREMSDVLHVESKDGRINRLRIHQKGCFYLKSNRVFAETTDAGNGILIHDGHDYRVKVIETINIGFIS